MKFDMRDPQSAIPVGTARIYVDGTQVREVVMADEEAGVVEVWETNEQGKVIAFYDEAGTPEPRLKRLTGIVKIEFPKVSI